MNQGTSELSSLYERLIGQLDTLVPFLALAHQEVFEVVSAGFGNWYSDERVETLPDSYDSYTEQVAHAAFLLGYSYLETFVSDVISAVYDARRDLLPEDKQLRFGDVTALNDFQQVIDRMIDHTIDSMNSLERKVDHIEKRLGIRVGLENEVRDAHSARNALIHNAGLMDRKDSYSGRWKQGDRISMSPDDVHEFGMMAREYARELIQRAEGLCADSKTR